MTDVSPLSTAPSRRHVAILITLCAIAYLPAWLSFFVKDDIALLISARPDLISALNHSWPGGFFRPTAELAISLQYHFFGFTPLPYHLVSFSAHLAAALLVYRIFGLFPQYSSSNFVAAALFALHPLNTETVSWISGQMNLYSALCALTTLYLLASSRALAALLPVFLLGLGFYENFLFVLPLWAALCLFHEQFRNSLRPLSLLLLGGFTLTYLYWRFAVLNLGGGYYQAAASLKSSLTNAAYYIYLLAGGSAIGGRIIHYQPMDIATHFFDVFTPLFILNSLVAIGYLFYLRRDGWPSLRTIALPLAWVILTLLPALLLPERPRRLAYLAVPGYAMAMSQVFYYLQQKTRPGLLVARAGIALYLLVLVSTLFLRNRDWQQAGNLERSLSAAIAPDCREVVFDVPNLLGDALLFNSISTGNWANRRTAVAAATIYAPFEFDLHRVSPDCYYRYANGSVSRVDTEHLQPVFTRGQNWAHPR
jgi:hypothetical protein